MNNGRRVEVRQFYHQSNSTLAATSVTTLDSVVLQAVDLVGNDAAGLVKYINLLSLTYQHLVFCSDASFVSELPVVAQMGECWYQDKVDETDAPSHAGDVFLFDSELNVSGGTDRRTWPSRILHRRWEFLHMALTAPTQGVGTGTFVIDQTTASARPNTMMNPGCWAPTYVKRRARLDLDDCIVFHREFAPVTGESVTEGDTFDITFLYAGVVTYSVTT